MASKSKVRQTVLDGTDPQRTLIIRAGAHQVAVRGGRIVAGADGPAETVELPGSLIVPGFVDCHVHFPSWALSRREVQLRGSRSLAQALERVAGAAPGPGWLRGRGWREEEWPDGDRPDKRALDAVTGERPTALRAQDGHSLWLNSAALALGRGDLQVPGGVVEVDDAGEPTGILREESAWRFLERHAEPSAPETLAAVRDALPAAAAAGVTGIHDFDGARGAPEAFSALRDAGELTLRVWQSFPAARLDDPPQLQADEWLRFGCVKAFMDGTLGSRTALLIGGGGVRITGPDQLAEMVRRAAELRLAVAVHAIGDLANREALDALESTREEWQPLGLRPRIEHAQCVHPGDVPRFRELGVTASVQFSHATSDREIAARLWADRLDRAYPYRALLDAGARLGAGSDAPVEELDPPAGLRAAEECGVSREDALAGFTSAAAWLEHAEERRGRLAPGFDADLVVLDGDAVVATMAGGRWTA